MPRRVRFSLVGVLVICAAASVTSCSSPDSSGGFSTGNTDGSGSSESADGGSGASSGSSGSTSGASGSSGSAGSSSAGSSGTGSSGSAGSSGSSGASGSGSSGSTGSSGAAGSSDAGSGSGPCDAYRAGNTPCVAAFSTVRALFGAYSRSLYQVTRADSTTMNIGVVSPGGVANAAAQDTFCSGTTCTISILYDQSGKGNDLTRAPKGSNNKGAQDSLAVANALPITIGGHKAYGVHIPPGTGYRNDSTKGVATGDEPEVIYEVSDGTYNPQGCCFDFGNAETQPVAGGDGYMEALLFGKAYWDTGSGSGPWVLADMEVGVYNHGGATGTGRVSNYPAEPAMAYPFVTAIIKGNSANASSGGPFTVKGANAQSGALSTWYDGARPQGYSPMRKQGAIVLGIGGDDSNTGGGNFFEGALTTGYSSDATDDVVQADIVAASYAK